MQVSGQLCGALLFTTLMIPPSQRSGRDRRLLWSMAALALTCGLCGAGAGWTIIQPDSPPAQYLTLLTWGPFISFFAAVFFVK